MPCSILTPPRSRSQLAAIILLIATLSFAAGATRPNVVFISMDDLNDWVSVLDGRADVKTPNISRLATMGQVFTNAHCPAPVCNSSRTAVFTGRLPSRTGIYSNNQWWRPAMPEVVTLPAHFRSLGYWTEGAGKNFHHTPGFNDPGAWDNYFFWLPSTRANGWDGGYQGEADPAPDQLAWPELDAQGNGEFDGAPLDVPNTAMPDRMVVDHAAEFLGQSHDKPFFLSVGIFRPHMPLYVQRPYFDEYPEGEVELPPYKADDWDDLSATAHDLTAHPKADKHAEMVKYGYWEEGVRSYLASVSFADDQLGILLDALENSVYAENTIVVLWSDHGFMHGEKDHWAKWALWRGVTRIPLLIVAPGVTTPGARSARPVNLIDLFPTLLELCGLPARSDVDGHSLVPLLREPQRSWDRPSLTTFNQGNHSLNGNRWHYIRYADGSEELYDFQADPNEWFNLAALPAYETVKRDFQRWLPQVNAEPALAKGAYHFDPANFTWTRKEPKKK